MTFPKFPKQEDYHTSEFYVLVIEQWKDQMVAQLEAYIQFIDSARSHSPSVEMKIKYEIYKEILEAFREWMNQI